MLALALLSCLANAPSGASLGPGEARSVVIQDANGAPVAAVQIRGGAATTVALAPGPYVVRGATSNETLGSFEVGEGETTRVVLPGDTEGPASGAAPSATRPPARASTSGAALPSGAVAVRPQDASKPDAETPPPWRRWGAPLLSAVLPGLGQAVNHQPAKAIGAFGGTVGLLAGAALARPSGGTGSAGVLDPGALAREDTAALAGFGILVHAAAALYIAQILDAHAVARGRPVRAHREARVRVQLGRSTALAMAPGAENVALYADTSIAVLARVSPRVSVGVADLGLKVGPASESGTAQNTGFHGGVRSMVRLLDARPRWMSRAGEASRLWLLAGGGATVHATIRTDEEPGLRPESPVEDRADNQTAVTLYALGEAHYFLLDRWSLALAPRLSVPLATRHYASGRALPRYSPTFELGLSLGVWL